MSSAPVPARLPLLRRLAGLCSERRQSTLVAGSHLLRHAHAPRVDEQLPQFVDVDGIEADAVGIPPLGGHLSTGFDLWKGVPHGEATPVVLAGVQT